jgi:hypothetical protein
MDNLEKAFGAFTIGKANKRSRSRSRNTRSLSSSYSNSSGEKERKRLLSSKRTNRVTIKVSRRGSEREAWKRAKEYIKDGYNITEIKLAKNVY